MIVQVMSISNFVLTQQIYSEETNGAHRHNRDSVPLIKSLQPINDRKELFEHDIRFLSAAFLHVQLVNTTLRRLQRRFLAPLFQYLIQYSTLN